MNTWQVWINFIGLGLAFVVVAVLNHRLLKENIEFRKLNAELRTSLKMAQHMLAQSSAMLRKIDASGVLRGQHGNGSDSKNNS